MGEAYRRGVPQCLLSDSIGTLESNYVALANLDVRNCQASHTTDKATPWDATTVDNWHARLDIDVFNEDLHDVIFGQGGLLAWFMDAQGRGAHHLYSFMQQLRFGATTLQWHNARRYD